MPTLVTWVQQLERVLRVCRYYTTILVPETATRQLTVIFGRKVPDLLRDGLVDELLPRVDWFTYNVVSQLHQQGMPANLLRVSPQQHRCVHAQVGLHVPRCRRIGVGNALGISILPVPVHAVCKCAT